MRTLLAVIAAALLSPGTARPDGKCGDAPHRLASGRLVVTWVTPIPAGAAVQQVGNEVFQLLGSDDHPQLLAKYRQKRKAATLQDSFVASSLPELQQWEAGFGITPEPEPARLLSAYFTRGYRVYGTLVEHPDVPEARRPAYTICSCTLQRALIVWDAGQERIYVRSWFHSAAGPGEAHNFAPAGGLLVSYPAPDRITLPLGFSEVTAEPNSYPVTEILTKKPLNTSWIPSRWKVAKLPPVSFEGATWQAVRLTARMNRGEVTPDLDIPAPR